MSVDVKIPPKMSKCKYGAVQEAIKNAPQPRSLERYGDGDLVFSFRENKKVIKMETSPQIARNNYFSFKQKIMAKIHEQRKERWVANEARKLIYDQEILEEELIDLEEDLALTDSDEEEVGDTEMKEEKENNEKEPKEEETDNNDDVSDLPDDSESQDVKEDDNDDYEDEDNVNDDIADQSSPSPFDDKEDEEMVVNRKGKPKVIDDEDESNDSLSVHSENLSESIVKPKSKKNKQEIYDDEVSMDDIIDAIASKKRRNHKRTETDLSDIEEDYDAENEEEDEDDEDEDEEADEVDSEEEAEEIKREEKRSKNAFVNDEAQDASDEEEEDEPNEEDIAMINDEEDEDEEEYDDEEDPDDDKENKNGEEDEEEKEVRPTDFFFNEAEVSGTDSSDDEDGEDEIVRELIDEEADKLDAEKIRKGVAQTYHKELLNEDKRVLLQLQERYLEDGDLHSDHKRAKKFRWGTASSAWLDNARDSDSSSNEEDEEDDDNDDENIPVFRLRNTSLPLSSTENKMSDLSSKSGSSAGSSILPSTITTLNRPSSSITSYLVRDKQLNNILSTKRSDPFDRHRGMGIKKLKPESRETKSLFDLFK